ncbi:MAG: OB-fold nucleic acid binding domain-containing protein [Candidatus Helarchaeota archaeon]
MDQIRRRRPAQERRINELSDRDLQNRVRILGSVVDIKSIQDQEQEQICAILDDGTGRIQVIINHPITLQPGDQIRIFGILSRTEENEYIINAEIIQDMSALDIELYKRVQDVKRKFKDLLNPSI